MYAYVEPKIGYGHNDLIAFIVKILECDTFLELGVATGGTANSVKPFVKRWIGVDVKDLREGEKFGQFFQCSTDDFFKFFKEEVQIVLVDADHCFESAKKDFENSLKILAKNGLIFMHDTDPREVRLLDSKQCGDSYKIIDYIHNERKDLNIITLPVLDAGLSIVGRKSDRRVFNFLPKI
jgi:hypothetical protein